MRILLACVLVCTLATIARGQGKNYTVGVPPEYYGTILNDLSKWPTLQIQNYTIPPLNTLADFVSDNINRFNYIVYTYNTTLHILANNFSIPYLIIPEIGTDLPITPNMFYTASIRQQTDECVLALLNFFNESSVVFIDYQPNPQLQSLLNFNNRSESILQINSSTDLTKIFVNQLPYNTISTYICELPFNESGLIEKLLLEAMNKGQLNPGKKWIFTQTSFDNSDFNLFKNFSNVGANIYGIKRLPSKEETVFQKDLFRDYIYLINSSISLLNFNPNNPSGELLRAKYENGSIFREIYFDNVTRKLVGPVISVRKVNTLQNLDDKPPEFSFNNNLTVNIVNNNLNDPKVTIRIGVTYSKGYFMQKPSGQYYGYSIAFLNAMQNLTNFKFQFIFANTANNLTTYDQLNELITQGMVDIVLIPMAESIVTSQADKSSPVLTMTMKMLTRGPDLLFVNVALAPFSYNVWFGIILIILLMTLGFWAVTALSLPTPSKEEKKNEDTYSFAFCLLIIYSSFVMAKLKVKLLQPSIQIFAFILWFSTLTIIISYASNLMPYLMKTTTIYPFAEAKDLLNRTDRIFKYVFINRSEDIQLIKNDSDLSVLYNTALSQMSNTMFIEDRNSEDILKTSGLILIQNDLKNSYIYNTLNCSSDILPGTITSYKLVFPINSKSIYAGKLKDLISNLVSSGVSGFLSIVYFGQGPCAKASLVKKPSPQPLTLEKLLIIFLFVVAGIFFGVGFVIISWLCGKCCRCIRNMNREPFLIGQKYAAQVSSLESTGVWAFINKRDRPYYIHSSSLHPDLRKQYSPKELDISPGDVLQLKYFGKDPVNGYKRFCKDFTEA